MKKFEFSAAPPQPTFTGCAFYSVYKNAEFLRHSANIETLLSKEYQLRHSLKDVPPGHTVEVHGMDLERNTPLLVKKTGKDVTIEDFEFTHNRLKGLTAAYAFDNRHRFPIIKSSEAEALGLKWDYTNEEKCKLYLSAVSGTEYFSDQFSFWPLVCALRKLQLKKITPEPVEKIAKMKNSDKERLAKVLKKNFDEATRLWEYFPGSSLNDMKLLLAVAPPKLKRVFSDN